jgi:hypothetical protein
MSVAITETWHTAAVGAQPARDTPTTATTARSPSAALEIWPTVMFVPLTLRLTTE